MQTPYIPIKIDEKVEVEYSLKSDNENLIDIRITFLDFPVKFLSLFNYEIKATSAFRYCSEKETEKLTEFFISLYKQRRKDFYKSLSASQLHKLMTG